MSDKELLSQIRSLTRQRDAAEAARDGLLALRRAEIARLCERAA